MQALQVLYHGENSDGKEKASLWLGELQKSVNLFSTPNDVCVCFRNDNFCFDNSKLSRPYNT